MALAMDRAALARFIHETFPQVADEITIDALSDDRLRSRLRVTERHLRPGGTVSGPAMFALADVSIYLAILSKIGPKALAVTTNCSMDFMRKPEAGADVICECRLLKLGRVLAVGECLLYSDGQSDPVARASMTYSIPPER